MTRRKTHQEFIEQMAQKHPDIEVLGQYISTRSFIKVKHSCGHVWEVRTNDLLQGHGCPIACNNKFRNKKKTHEEFIAEITLIQADIKVLEQYVNDCTKIKIQHSCGFVWSATPHSILRGLRCPGCYIKKGTEALKKDPKKFKEQMAQMHPDIQLLEQYVNSKTKIKLKHSCGYIWTSSPNHLLQGGSCPSCCHNKKLTHQEFVKKEAEINPDIEILGKYINSRTKVSVKHSCGYIWKTKPNNLLKGLGCPKCSIYGFHLAQPAIFYIYEIIKNKDIYYGFGISNVYNRREKQHLKNLSKEGANITSKWLYQFESGYDCKGIEADLKATLKESGLQHNLGIEGFLTECAKEEARSLIMHRINKAVCQPIHATA